MSLLADINNAIYHYVEKNGRQPTAISIGSNARQDLLDILDVRLSKSNNDKSYYQEVIYGCKIKWVKRKNYLECLPRPKRIKQWKREYDCVFT